MLLGAREMLGREKPPLIVETEERHNAGSVGEVSRIAAELGYRRFFLQHGQLRDGRDFTIEKNQDMANQRDYVRNSDLLARAAPREAARREAAPSRCPPKPRRAQARSNRTSARRVTTSASLTSVRSPRFPEERRDSRSSSSCRRTGANVFGARVEPARPRTSHRIDGNSAARSASSMPATVRGSAPSTSTLIALMPRGSIVPSATSLSSVVTGVLSVLLVTASRPCASGTSEFAVPSFADKNVSSPARSESASWNVPQAQVIEAVRLRGASRSASRRCQGSGSNE